MFINHHCDASQELGILPLFHHCSSYKYMIIVLGIFLTVINRIHGTWILGYVISLLFRKNALFQVITSYCKKSNENSVKVFLCVNHFFCIKVFLQFQESHFGGRKNISPIGKVNQNTHR